jgi:hypothetical protein
MLCLFCLFTEDLFEARACYKDEITRLSKREKTRESFMLNFNSFGAINGIAIQMSLVSDRANYAIPILFNGKGTYELDTRWQMRMSRLNAIFRSAGESAADVLPEVRPRIPEDRRPAGERVHQVRRYRVPPRVPHLPQALQELLERPGPRAPRLRPRGSLHQVQPLRVRHRAQGQLRQALAQSPRDRGHDYLRQN